jgi:hypothetical protein
VGDESTFDPTSTGMSGPYFFEKVQLHFQLANLLIQFILLCVGLLADLLAAIAEDIRQTSQGLFIPTSHLGGMDTKHLRGHRHIQRFGSSWTSINTGMPESTYTLNVNLVYRCQVENWRLEAHRAAPGLEAVRYFTLDQPYLRLGKATQRTSG